jgi:hypothetical protein
MAQTNQIRIAALRLRNASPEAWELFLTALDADAYQAMTDLVLVSTDQILGKQGQVQAYTHWLRIFKNCDVEPKS